MDKRLPWSGYYHYKSEEIFTGFKEYLEWYKSNCSENRVDGEKVGIFFSRSLLIKNDTECVDILIAELEKRKIIPVPVFTQKEEYGGPGCPGHKIDLKLLKGVDLIINCESSFLLSVPPDEVRQKTVLEELAVPVIQAVYSSGRTEKEWRQSPQGITPSNQIYWVAQPEFNGTIEPVVISARDEKSKDTYGQRRPIEERIRFLVERVMAWLKLKQLPSGKRRVTFLLHNNPCAGVESSVGGGAGLDTLESVVRMMKEMKERGYDVVNCPETGKELAKLILDKKAVGEFRWTTVEEIVKKGGVIEFITMDKYNQWLNELPPSTREKMIRDWAEPPGKSMVYNGKIVVTGLNFGNVKVLAEPKRGCYGARCDGEVCKILHDPCIAPTHQCLATYKWAQENSDMIISVGTHGYIEFLPGKSVGMSNECFPEIITGTVPHLYIYTIKNPSEGILAKRRAYAVIIDHMIPVMKPSGLYDELGELEELLKQYTNAKNLDEDTRCKIILKDIVELCEKIKLLPDKKNSEAFNLKNPEVLIEYLHNKLNLLGESQINDGLHILSQVPDSEGMAEMITLILRFDGNRPSIRRLVLEILGYDYKEIIENPKKFTDGKNYGEILKESTEIANQLIKAIILNQKRIKDYVVSYFSGRIKRKEKIEELVELLNWVENKLYPDLMMTKTEILQVLSGINKNYIQPGPAGLITRGKTEVLPTGRNFYSIDPRMIPTRAAWQVGIKMAEELLKKYLKEEGNYPENIGMVLWSIDGYRADGEQLSQILYLMGARPVWTESGVVKETEVIPLKELKRPRIDVTIRTSEIFRDTLPHLIELLDETIIKIAQLDEKGEDNFIKKHFEEYKRRYPQEVGSLNDEKEALRLATLRIFCGQPGAYGCGVKLMLAASAWKTLKDLGEIYIKRGGYGYGKEIFGKPAHREFAHQLSTVQAVFHKLETDETDPLGCCFYDFQGGMFAASKSLSGRSPKVLWGDTRDPSRPKIRDMKDEIERAVRTRLLNPEWIEGMKRHGYKGAGDMAKKVVAVYGWDASAEVVDDWIFDELAKKYVLDEEMRKFFEKNNPWALEEIGRRLLEAHQRKLWNADPEVLEKLKETYLEIESWLEEKMGDIQGDFQGGSVDILTSDDVEEWKSKMKNIKEMLK